MAVTNARLELEVARIAVERGASARFCFPVVGRSMAPALVAGMRVTVESVPPESLVPGDLVCWYDSGPWRGRKVVHRFVRFAWDEGGGVYVVTRGDASRHEDPPVPAEQVIGRVVAVRRPSVATQLKTCVRRFVRTTGKVVQMMLRPVLRQIVPPRIAYGTSDRLRDEAEGADRRPNRQRTVFSREATLLGRTVGLAFCHPCHHAGPLCWRLSGVETEACFRGLGIAARLCRELCDEAFGTGARRIVLLAFPDNRPALRLYWRLGFRRAADPALERTLTELDPPPRKRVLLERLADS
jgi:RimJ/RimL family protein N-acetyltransferase